MHSALHLSQTDSRPLYLQILEQIRARVAAGDWPAGKELPSIRSLAAALNVSVITIKRAYLDLEAEGVIVTRHGKGSFVAESRSLDLSVSAKPQQRKLDEHLAAAAEIAQRLGLSHAELAARLHLAMEERK